MKKIDNAIYIRQKLVCVLACLFIMILFCAGFSLHAQAAEKDETQEAANVQGNLMAAAVDTVGLEQPKEGAAPVVKLQAGTHLLVVGEETNGWCEIYYQGKTAFVPAADMTAATSLDAEALDQEMQKIGEEDAAFIESLEMQRKAIARSKVWRSVIIMLIILLFIISILSVVIKSKNEKSRENTASKR